MHERITQRSPKSSRTEHYRLLNKQAHHDYTQPVSFEYIFPLWSNRTAAFDSLVRFLSQWNGGIFQRRAFAHCFLLVFSQWVGGCYDKLFVLCRHLDEKYRDKEVGSPCLCRLCCLSLGGFFMVDASRNSSSSSVGQWLPSCHHYQLVSHDLVGLAISTSRRE